MRSTQRETSKEIEAGRWRKTDKERERQVDREKQVKKERDR